MTAFCTFLNPAIPLLRLLRALFMGAFSALTLHLWTQKEGLQFGFLIGVGLSGYMAYTFGRGLLTQTRNYSISYDGIVVKDFITWRTCTVPRSEILGYSRSTIKTRVWTFDQLILHTSQGQKFSLAQFSYFNFKHIESILKGYRYQDLTATKQ